jgi:hypothetical protein
MSKVRSVCRAVGAIGSLLPIPVRQLTHDKRIVTDMG